MSIKNLLFQKDKELHHAYLITGDIEQNIGRIRNTIENFIGADVGSYPDYYLHFTPSFSIDDGRLIIEKQKTVSFGGGDRFFIIASFSYNPVAQNGLLKVLEEPIAGNHFFVLSTNEETLLPTLRSRLLHIRGEELSYDEIGDWCDKFVVSDITDRMVMIEKFLKDEEKEEDNKMAKHKAKDILSRIEKTFSGRILSDDREENLAAARFLSELLHMKSYLNDTAPSVRLILEYIAFICP